jgi:hypothetical protein
MEPPSEMTITLAGTPSRGTGLLQALREPTSPGALKRQVIAFHDPSDALTWEIPEEASGERLFANVYVRNARPVLGLVAHPGFAHLDYWRNATVRRIMFGPAPRR